MNSLGLFFRLLLLSCLLGSSLAYAQKDQKPIGSKVPTEDVYSEKTSRVDTVADQLEYSREKQKVIAKGNVVIRYGNTQLTADYAEVETQTKKAYARGHVIVFQNGQERAQGEEIYYDFENHSGEFPKGRAINPPWFSSGLDIKQIRQGYKVVDHGRVTTCDLEKPHYEFRATKVSIYDNDKLIARNVTIYVLGKPIFWWPYLVIPLQQGNLPLAVTAGYNSRYGGYLLIAKGISIIKQIGGKIHIDWRSKRGFGGGLDLGYNFGPYARGVLRTYLTQDKRAPSPGQGNPYSQFEGRTRGRITWIHRSDFDPNTHLILRYNRLADEFFLQDFFEHENRAEVQPQSFVTFTKNSDRYGFLTHVEKRMNRFETTVERLPEVRFDLKTQPIFKPWLYQESQLSYADLSKRFSRSTMNEDVTRADGFNEWSIPLKWKEIKLTTYGDLRGTYYSRQRDEGDDQFRTVLGTGADLRTQFYRTFPVTFDALGIEANQLRHVFEPSVHYKFLTSSVSDEKLNMFDSIDQIDDAQKITFGIENRLQTKRVVNGKMQRVDLVSLNTFLNYEIRPDGRLESINFAPFEDGSTASSFTVWDQEVVLRPYEWLRYEARMSFNMRRQSMRVFNQDLLATYRRIKIVFGHRFINDLDGFKKNDQFVFSGSWTVNPLWELGGYIRWDSEHLGLEEWQLSATRDLHDFVLDFGYNVRNSAIRNSNKELFFNFHFKGLPQYALRSGGQRATFSEPRIGETVAGANQRSSRTSPYETY